MPASRKRRTWCRRSRFWPSPDIPNDTLSFSPDFPEELRPDRGRAGRLRRDRRGMRSIGNQDYGWTGINPATDAEYDVVRAMNKRG
ncbi:MAG: hypothetical protein R3A10_18035 [Caldilineaceae bacterium]